MLSRLAYATLVVIYAFTLSAALADPCTEAGLPRRELRLDDFHINSDTEAIQLYMRNKRPADVSRFGPERILLYVHGATYPSETAFDLDLGGFSWMDYIACHGWDVYLVDVRGYGRSTRPAVMDQPAEDGEPIVRTEMAVRDVSAAVDHILEKRRVRKLNLLGWSWGTAIMGTYASVSPNKVHRLVLYAPLWLRKTSSLITSTGVLGAYRTVTQDAAKKRWLTGVPLDKQFGLIPEGWFEKWAQETWATDPQSPDTGLLRAPNGVLQDVREYWSVGKPSYEPSAILAPTLLIRGDWDQDTPGYMAQALMERLKNAPKKRLSVIPEATHSVIMEKNRMQLFRDVQTFLEER